LLNEHLGGINKLEPTEIIHCDRPAGFLPGHTDKIKIDDSAGFFLFRPSSPLML